MTTRQVVMIQPVRPGSVLKLRLRKARNRRRVVVADGLKFGQQENTTIAQVAVWKVRPSEGLIKVDDIV